MNVLELFAGSRSVGKVCDALGYTSFSIDNQPFENISLIGDIEEVLPQHIPFIPDIIWASPPCTSYSIAAISHHRDNQLPKTELAIKSDRLIKHVISLVSYYETVNPQVKFFIENPVGMLRKMFFMQHISRTTVTYCQYGDSRMKPTDIWTNDLKTLFNPYGWQPRAMCRNGKKCHEAAPRGSKTGTQGLKNDYERGKIPEMLILEILNQIKVQ